MSAGVAILKAFYRTAGEFVRADSLSLPARTVSTEIEELRQLGYNIESHPHFGYRLLGSPDRLIADDLKARLSSGVIGSEVLVFEQTSSTNDIVERMAASQSGEGLVVFAEAQTKGRGRHGRAWASPRGKGLWFSVLLRPKFPLPRVTVAASVAVARVIRTAGLDARIKWPNDVTVGGRKIAGILTEVCDAAAILGVGLNVNCGAEDFPAELRSAATSLEIETGQPQDRPTLAARLLTELDALYRQADGEFDEITAEWARWSTTLGKQLVVTMGKRRIEGHGLALDGNGALLLRRDNGRIERILGADVTVEK